MHVHRTYNNEAGTDGGLPGGAPAPAAPAPAAATPTPAPAAPASAPAASPAPADGAPGGAAAQPGSLMARAAAAAAAGPAPAGAPAADGAAEGQPAAIADKFLVKNEAGEVDWQASALKQAEAYAGLEKRMGAGEAPPKSPEEYAPELPQGWDADRLKADPLFAGFLKGAHAKGLNNAQVSYILSEFQARQDMQRSPEVGQAELMQRMSLREDQLQSAVYAPAFRASKAFAADEGMLNRLDQKFGSDPDYLQLMARIGKELGEDRGPGPVTSAEVATLEDLKLHPAYLDAKHPEHRKVAAQVTALYAKLYPEKA